MLASQKITKATLQNVGLCPPNAVYNWATTLVIAPHPDDETLCCGGAIALLRQMGYRVHVMILADGANMHPRAEFMSPGEFRNLRRAETEHALSKLGVSNDSITFLNLADSLLPAKGEAGFEEVVRLCRNKIHDLKPDTILAPWRRDLHRDHRATWQITRQALIDEQLEDINLVEYAVWALYAENEHDLPTLEEVQPWRLDTKPVIEQKIAALNAYQPSLNLIGNEDKAERAYSSEILSHFTHPWELYLDQNNGCC